MILRRSGRVALTKLSPCYGIWPAFVYRWQIHHVVRKIQSPQKLKTLQRQASGFRLGKPERIRERCLVLGTLYENGSFTCESSKKTYVTIQRQTNPQRLQDYALSHQRIQKHTPDYYKLVPERKHGTRSEFSPAEACPGVVCGRKLGLELSEHVPESLHTSCKTPLAPQSVSKCICQNSTVNHDDQSRSNSGIDGSVPWESSCTNGSLTLQKGPFEIGWPASHDIDCLSLLRWCGSAETLCVGKRVHHTLCCDGIESDSFIGTVLVEMYLKCQSFENAHSIFFGLHVHSTFSWNLVIRSYTSQGQDAEALLCINWILAEASLPDKFTFVSLLSCCVRITSLAATRRIHVCILTRSHQSDIIVRNALINAYSKCDSISDAQHVFDMMSDHDSFSWDTLIAAYAKNGLHDEPLCLFYQQQHQAMLPTRITYTVIIESLGNNALNSESKYILSRIFGSDFKSNASVQASVLYFFGKIGWKESAWRIFGEMSERDIFSWNVILATCTYSFHGKGVVELFCRILGEGLLPGQETLTHTISLCKDLKTLQLGKYLHACFIICPNSLGAVVSNALVSMYSRCARLEDAYRAFGWIPERNIVTWTTMVGAYVEHGQAMLALELFGQMLGEGVLADKIMLINLLDACASLCSPARIKRFHACIRTMGLDIDLEVGSCLASLYGKCGALKLAEKMFDSILDRNTLLWTAMISAFAGHHHPGIAIEFFQRMKQESILPNEVTYFGVLDSYAKMSVLMEARRFHAHLSYSGFDFLSVKTALIDMYGRCGNLQEAQRVFDDAAEHDIVLLTAMMAIHTRSGHVKHALHLFDMALQRGVKPDEVAYINILSMCSHAGLVEEGRRYFSSMTLDYQIKPTIHHYSCMIDLYGRAGCVRDAEHMITKMPYTATALQWMTLLSACRRQFDVERGERAARHVMLLQPGDPVSYIELANIYSAGGREAEAAVLLNKVKELEALRSPSKVMVT